VGLDRLLGNEEALRDLAVRPPAGGHLGHPKLARRERIATASGSPTRPRSRREKLGQRAILEPAGAAAVGVGEAFVEQLTSGSAPPAASSAGRPRSPSADRTFQPAATS
jgi:hypothetical protein